jgi:hypothetical protein
MVAVELTVLLFLHLNLDGLWDVWNMLEPGWNLLKSDDAAM